MVRILVFALLVAALPAKSSAQDPAQSLANILWTPQQLAATAAEKRSGPLAAPAFAPPGRTAPQHAAPPLPPVLQGSIRSVDTGGEKVVALTFDLCELADKTAGYDGEIVDYLRSQGAQATFFASGHWLKTHPLRSMQLMADPLFELGNHAWTHGNMGVLTGQKMRDQITWTQAQYELLLGELALLARAAGREDLLALTPARMATFRFPYGRCSPQALAALAEQGLAAVQWDVNTMDAGPRQTPEGIARIVLRNVKPGSIVLCHANGNGHGTAGAMRLIVPELAAKGYRFVTVSALLAMGKARTSPECYDSKPGDTAVYDAQFGEGVLHPKRK